MRTRPSFFLLALPLLCLPSLSSAQESPSIIELSTRGVPLVGQISFLKPDGTPAGDPVEVRGERFIWREIPFGATRFTVTSVANTSPPIDLIPGGHTFATVNPIQPLDPKTLASGVDLQRLPLVEAPRPLPAVAAGSTGWIFVGTLTVHAPQTEAGDDSDWDSLYLLNASDRKKPDSAQRFTFADLKSRAKTASPENPEASLFIADFPLRLRDSPKGDSAPDLPVVRPGQTIEIEEVSLELPRTVMAKVTVK